MSISSRSVIGGGSGRSGRALARAASRPAAGPHTPAPSPQPRLTPLLRLTSPDEVFGGDNVERDFRHIKSDDLDLRPVFHRLEERVRPHVLICMLACYLTWHLRRAWAPLTFTDEDPLAPAGKPVAPPDAPPPPRPRPQPSTTRQAAPTAASAACSSTWPP